MSTLSLLFAALFLPLFPLSIVFNQVLTRIQHPLARSVVLLLWPLPGVLAVSQTGDALSPWIMTWAALTALLYGFRMLTQREINRWIGFLATAVWSLLWFPALANIETTLLAAYTLAFSLPLAMLMWLAVELEQRFGAAYTHLYGGLANNMPRFSGVLVFCILAAVATPLFPSFFIMLKALIVASPMTAIIILTAWLTWSWAGIRLLQGLLLGQHNGAETLSDITQGKTWGYALALIMLTIVGLLITGDMS